MFSILNVFVIGLAAIVLLYPCLVSYLRGIGWHGHRITISGGPDKIAPTKASTYYADSYYRQLIEQGFEPMGELRESVWFQRSSYIQAFHHPSGCRASIFEIFHKGPRLGLRTEFEPNLRVETFNYDRPSTEHPTKISGGVPTHSVPALLAAHRETCEGFGDSQVRLCPTLDDCRDAVERDFIHPAVQSEFRDNTRSIAFNEFKTVFAAALPASLCVLAMRGRDWAFSVPISLLFAAVLAALLRKIVFAYVLHETIAALNEGQNFGTATEPQQAKG